MSSISSKSGRGGRPQIVNRELIIDAGVAVGIDNLTMKKVADNLGVSVAALYQYITDRDDLRMAVLGRILDTNTLPRDTGQHWSLFIREFVRSVRKRLAEFPGVIVRRLEDPLSPDWQAVVLIRFQEVLCKRGFTADEAVTLAYLSSAAANGAAAIKVDVAQSHIDQPIDANCDSVHAIRSDPDVVTDARRLFGQQTEDLAWQLLRPCLERYAELRGEDPDVVATWWRG